MVNIGNSWDEVLKGEFEKDYYLKLREFLKAEYGSRVIYPDMYDIFNALKFTPYEDVKAVILGQDPYHEPGQAHGLCFSVQKGVQKPPSLVNIFKELQDDLGIDPPSHGNLESEKRRASAQYGFDGSQGSGRFSPWAGLGDLYGSGDPAPQRQGKADGVHPLGRFRKG
mgnify:CR=1 FL=1